MVQDLPILLFDRSTIILALDHSFESTCHQWPRFLVLWASNISTIPINLKFLPSDSLCNLSLKHSNDLTVIAVTHQWLSFTLILTSTRRLRFQTCTLQYPIALIYRDHSLIDPMTPIDSKFLPLKFHYNLSLQHFDNLTF